MSRIDNLTNELRTNISRVMSGILNELSKKSLPQKDNTKLGLSSTTIITVTSFLCFVIVVAVVGNVVALVTIQVCRELNNITCYFVTNLCISDLMVSLLSLPFWISFIHNGWPSQEDGLVYKLWICLDIFCGCFSITNLALVSIERYFYIVYPLNFESIITKKRAKILTGATPMYGIIASLIGFVRMEAKNPYLIIPVVFLAYVIPVGVMCFANGNTYLVTKSHFKFIEQQEKDRKRLISMQTLRFVGRPTHMRDTTNEGQNCCCKNKLTGNNMPDLVKETTETRSNDRPSIDDNGICFEQNSHAKSGMFDVERANSMTLIRLEGMKEWEEYVTDIESRGQNLNAMEQKETEVENRDGQDNGMKLHRQQDEGLQESDVVPQRLKFAVFSSKDLIQLEVEGNEKAVPNALESSSGGALPKDEDANVTKHRSIWRLRGLKRELKAAKAIGLIIGTFLLLWTPFMVVVLLNSFNVRVQFKTAMIVKSLHYTNSAINPILYAALNKIFRASLRRLPSRVKI